MANHSFRILLLGSGGREHALAWKLSQSPDVDSIFCVPGNGGTFSTPKCLNINTLPSIEASSSFPALVDFARTHNINLLIPGPEAPLVAGVVDYFEEHLPSVKCFGPNSAAARMEGSKAFAKAFLRRHSIPTASYEVFTSFSAASSYLASITHPIVIKASGLAAGKGVIIPTSPTEAQGALKAMMEDKEFGAAGNEVVIEELLSGPEVSILCFSDGETMHCLPMAQDHKRIGDGDTGGNTGGMGAYAPCHEHVMSKGMILEIERTILRPTIDGMRKEGFPFKGCLFPGLMITESGPKVLEFNVRFGDPEVQTLLPLLSKETDLARLAYACTTGGLHEVNLGILDECAATVVVAAGGYPGSYKKGTPISTGAVPEGCQLFHAGTMVDEEGQLRTSGGRVIAATATGKDFKEAVDRAYEGVRVIKFEGMYFRKDIAATALR
ncbi:MAG: hypothetical protein M1820_005418 [Bogoriella megaspora]|nr:MAG: hypothetical protein M1820_005418 [Bogoriella megaspora]